MLQVNKPNQVARKPTVQIVKGEAHRIDNSEPTHQKINKKDQSKNIKEEINLQIRICETEKLTVCDF